ncbi:MAG TPA: hypothetical protein VF606_11280 [Geminicoccaceae bacterium]
MVANAVATTVATAASLGAELLGGGQGEPPAEEAGAKGESQEDEGEGAKGEDAA